MQVFIKSVHSFSISSPKPILELPHTPKNRQVQSHRYTCTYKNNWNLNIARPSQPLELMSV